MRSGAPGGFRRRRRHRESGDRRPVFKVLLPADESRRVARGRPLRRRRSQRLQVKPVTLDFSSCLQRRSPTSTASVSQSNAWEQNHTTGCKLEPSLPSGRREPMACPPPSVVLLNPNAKLKGLKRGRFTDLLTPSRRHLRCLGDGGVTRMEGGRSELNRTADPSDC